MVVHARVQVTLPILLTEAIGITKSVATLRKLGLTLPQDASARGGLALAVGGLEVSLLELTNAYATLARSGEYFPVRIFEDESNTNPTKVFCERTCGHLNHCLASWEHAPAGMDELPPRDRPWFMWKSGTSSGHRDAWALGHNGNYAIGIWVGRFDGQGDPAFVGREAAGPILGEAFTRLVAPSSPPPTPAPIQVNRPYHFDRMTLSETGPRIIEPAQDLVIECQETYYQQIRGVGDHMHWFLNGERIELPTDHIRLHPGTHRLVVVDQSGQRDTRQIVVQRARSSAIR